MFRLLCATVLAVVLPSLLISANSSIQPLKVDFSDKSWTDLQHRLQYVNWPPVMANASDWSLGTPVAFMQELVEYWRTKYDFNRFRSDLTSLPHYTAQINGRALHFLHYPSTNVSAQPLMLLHGWPSSFNDYVPVVSLLNDWFHLVIPSIPGYAFSEAYPEPGHDFMASAKVYAELMAQLGYTKYLVEGGDWGFIIATGIGLVDAEHCVGALLRPVGVSFPFQRGVWPALKSIVSLLRPSWFMTEEEQENLNDLYTFVFEETAYAIMQATKVQTFSFGLHDSPTALAALLVEKWRRWSDCNGDIYSVFTRDQILDNVMIYWLTNSAGTAGRMYRETAWGEAARSLGSAYMTVPTGVVVFPKEVTRPPRAWMEYGFNVQYYRKMESGGHFAQMEMPTVMADLVKDFFSQLATANAAKEASATAHSDL